MRRYRRILAMPRDSAKKVSMIIPRRIDVYNREQQHDSAFVQPVAVFFFEKGEEWRLTSHNVSFPLALITCVVSLSNMSAVSLFLIFLSSRTRPTASFSHNVILVFFVSLFIVVFLLFVMILSSSTTTTSFILLTFFWLCLLCPFYNIYSALYEKEKQFFYDQDDADLLKILYIEWTEIFSHPTMFAKN